MTPTNPLARGALVLLTVALIPAALVMEKTPPPKKAVSSINSLNEADVRDSFQSRWDALYDERKSTWVPTPATYVQTASTALRMAPRVIPKDEERPPAAVPVQTVRIVPSGINPATLAQPEISGQDRGQDAAPPPIVRKRDVRPQTTSVCERHNMRQVWHGRSWRCQR